MIYYTDVVESVYEDSDMVILLTPLQLSFLVACMNNAAIEQNDEMDALLSATMAVIYGE